MPAKSRSLQTVCLLWLAATQGCIATPPAASIFDSGLQNHLGLTFSPDGRTAYWASWDGKWGSAESSLRQIYVSVWKEDRWSRPAPLPLIARSNNDDPYVSPDGRWLYFVSDALTSPDDTARDTNIWRYGLSDTGILEPLSINSDASEYSPIVTRSGAIYFASNRKGGPGAGDIYRAEPNGSGYHRAIPLGDAINSEHGEWNVWVSDDEQEIIFESSSRTTNVSIPGDLYFSWQSKDGWTAAIPIRQLNTENSDLMPRLHPDGTNLYYASAPIGGHARIEVVNWRQLRSQLRQ